MQSAYGPHNRPAIRELRISGSGLARTAANLSFTLVDEYRNVGRPNHGTVPIGGPHDRATMPRRHVRDGIDRDPQDGGSHRGRGRRALSLAADGALEGGRADAAPCAARAGDGDAMRYSTCTSPTTSTATCARSCATSTTPRTSRSRSLQAHVAGALRAVLRAVLGLDSARRPQRRDRPPARRAIHARRSAARTSRSRTSGASAGRPGAALDTLPHDQRQ